MKRASVLIISVLIILIGTSVHAQDARVNYSLSVSIEGTATVTSNPAGINCSDNTGTCSYSFPPGRWWRCWRWFPPQMSSVRIFFRSGPETLPEP